MKTMLRHLQPLLIAGAVLAASQFASAATKRFTISVSPTTTNVLAGVATNVAITVTDTSPSGNTFSGVVTNGVIVSPVGLGVTASYSSSSSVIISNSPSVPAAGSASLTLYVSATAVATSNIVYTITVTGTNTSATGNLPSGVASAKYSFILGNVPTMTWNPAGVDTNWSDGGNWSPNGPPGALNDATFVDLGAVGSAGTVDNVVDANLSIGSLTFGQTNNFHTTLIASGKTLTLGGDAVGLVVGTGTDNGGQLTTAAITGAGGTLLVTNTSANVLVSQNHSVTTGESSAQATLDLSGLDKFSATVSRLLVGVDLTIKGASGVLNLAKTNTITATAGSTAPQIDVGDNTLSQGSAGIPSVLLLGKTNGFFADSIAVGRGKTDNTGSSMSFNSIFASPTAYFRGTNGSASRVSTWSIGDAYGSKVTSYLASVGTCDFSLGTVDALVNTMYVGKGADASIANGANITGLGTLTLSAGTMDVNTLQVGVSVTVSGAGTVNVNGGTLLVNTSFLLANGSGSSGTLNLSNGVVTANNGITASGGTATINLAGGTLNATNSTATIGTAAIPVNTFRNPCKSI